MGKAIAIFNQKGGVGKTTTTINLSASIAKLGYKVLLIDSDPQGNTTSGIGVEKTELIYSLYNSLIDDDTVFNAIVDTKFDGLDLLPANIELAGAEIEMVQLNDREHRLENIINKVRSSYDYIFVDCPPSLGLLSINALVGVNSVLIPIQCEYYAIEGVSSLMNTFKIIKKGLNPDLEIEGVVLSMFDSRTNLSTQVAREVRKYFGKKVYDWVIPKNVRLAEAPSYGLPITEYDPNSKGGVAYMNLAKEFIKKGR